MPQLRPVDLEGRSALVAGDAEGLIAAFVDLLGSAGAEVAVAAEGGPALERMAIRLGVETVVWDPADPGAIGSAAVEVAERLGSLDLLVWTLGVEVGKGDDPGDFGATRIAGLRTAAERIAADRGGRILVVGPDTAFDAEAIRRAVQEQAVGGVTLNGVAHGPLRAEPEDWEEDVEAPVGTVTAADVARASLWLLDPETVGVSGLVVGLG